MGRPFTTEVLSLQVPPMLEPGRVQRTPPPVKPKPRTVKSAEVQEACCINFNILVLLNWTWVVKSPGPVQYTQLLHVLSKWYLQESRCQSPNLVASLSPQASVTVSGESWHGVWEAGYLRRLSTLYSQFVYTYHTYILEIRTNFVYDPY